jgi:hypothetical protein
VLLAVFAIFSLRLGANHFQALSASPIKRKASDVDDVDNSENIAPVLFPKRSKGTDLWGGLNSFMKPSTFSLSTKPTTSSSILKDVTSPASKISNASRPRAILEPKSPTARLKAKTAALSPSSPRTAPAGRSPPRSTKRIGILSRRISRPDPPSFGGASIPFSLDAALKGTIPSYSGRLRANKAKSQTNASTSSAPVDFFIPTPNVKSSWCFDIHEDTPEQEMTNLLQHSTCTLDISSDEESESRAKRDRLEGRDKENIPPPEDVSQTSLARGGPSSSRGTDAVDIDEDVLLLKGRGPLAEMNVTDFYAPGCDSSSVFIIPGDEEDPEAVVGEAEAAAVAAAAAEAERTGALSGLPALPENGEEEREWFEEDGHAAPHVSLVDVDDIMGDGSRSVLEAGLGPVEGADESFEIWESNSAKEAGSAPPSPGPLADDDVASQGGESDVL